MLAADIERAVRKVILRNLPLLCDEIAVELGLETRREGGRTAESTGALEGLPSAGELFRLAAAEGRVGLSQKLHLPREALARLVAVLGFDPSRRARRWKDADRIREYLVDEIMIRCQRNRSFLRESPAASQD